MDIATTDHQIEEIVHDLLEEFGRRVGPKQVPRRLDARLRALIGGPIQQFVPVLTRRIAREELLSRT